MNDFPTFSPSTPSKLTTTTTTTVTTTNTNPSSVPVKRQSLHTPIPRRYSERKSSTYSAIQGGSVTITTTTTTRRGSITRFSITPRDVKEDPSVQKDNDTDLLPLECLKQEQFLNTPLSFILYFSTYLACVLALHQLLVSVALATTNIEFSWTITNVVHCIVTLIYVHWKKGSLLLSDEQGGLNGMTVWEQLEVTPESSFYIRCTLQIVPTVLTYIACLSATHFKQSVYFINITLWVLVMIAKLPIMNGVRLFGINRTAGIDDDNVIVLMQQLIPLRIKKT